MRPVTLLIKKPDGSFFPVNFKKFLITLLLQNTSGRLLLFIANSKSDLHMTS